MMTPVISRDGARIAFERTGRGPALIVVNGTMGFRAFYGDPPLAASLSNDFTVYLYDRRGRGESTDVGPYAVEKEIDDIEALVDHAGGQAFLYGVSSGAALALLAAGRLGTLKVPKIALYEPPYGSDTPEAKQEHAEMKKEIYRRLSHGRRGDVAEFFVSMLGTPPEGIQQLRQTADWTMMESVEHTVPYDFEVLGDGSIPGDTVAALDQPTLLLHGDRTMPFMIETARALADLIPKAQLRVLKDQTHEVNADVIAPVLRAYFAS